MNNNKFYEGNIATDLDEVKLPETVYKYRNWDNKEHQTIIKERKVFFSPPSKFEDQLDCRNSARFDLLTKKQKVDLYRFRLKEDNPTMSRQQARNDARKWAKKGPLNSKKHLDQIADEDFKEFDSIFGVLSLTANPKSKEMWESYGNVHKGFCVGFNPKVAFQYFGGGGKVKYVTQLPAIMPRPINTFEEQHILRVFYKLAKWGFEEEYRIHKTYMHQANKADRTVSLPTNAYKEIIIGALAEEKTKKDIVEIAKVALPEVKILQAVLKDETIVLNEA